jgi:hypothetical protein
MRCVLLVARTTTSRCIERVLTPCTFSGNNHKPGAALDAIGHNVSNTVEAVWRPADCFNSKLDAFESDIDCGGLCARNCVAGLQCVSTGAPQAGVNRFIDHLGDLSRLP